MDNVRFLYLGEINQIRKLSYTLRQQNDYIRMLESPYVEPEESSRIRDARQATRIFDWVCSVTHIMLIPTSFLIYWIRRLTRIALNRRLVMHVSPHAPVIDRRYESGYTGTGRVYLFPEQRKAFPRGLVLLRYSLSLPAEKADSIIYINPGDGFLSEYSIPLPTGNSPDHEILIELPPDIALLQFRASSRPDEYRLSHISMTEISLVQAARYLKSRYGFNNDDVLNTLFIRKLPGVRRIIANKIPYAEWHYKYARLSSLDHRGIRTHVGLMVDPPLLSLIIQAHNTNPHYLDITLKSLHQQHYPHWELLVICSDTPDAHITTILNRYERYNNQIKIVIKDNPAGISNQLADAVASTQGVATALLNQGDMLTEHALYLVACYLSSHTEAGLLYSDHDHIDENGRLFDPCLKPDWSHEFLLGKDYIQPFVFYRSADLCMMATDLTSLDAPYYRDLFMVERLRAEQIVHIPYLLLHKRASIEALTSPSTEVDRDQALLEAHLQRIGQPAEVQPVASGFRIRRTISEPQPLVSLIVLTRDRVTLLSNCVNGLLNQTAWQNLEVIIIDNGSVDAATLSYIEAVASDPRVRVFRRPEDFNFSSLNNFAAEQAKGEYLGLLNNDISVIHPDWLGEMMSHLLRSDVGIVGAKLLYENETVQHAGVIIGLGGVAGHGLRHAPRNYPGYDDRLVLCQQLSCVTAACLLTKKSVYQSVGGLDEINLRIAFNDVDYCLKVRQQGWKIIWTPFAELYHLESASRGSDLSKANIDRWQSEYNFMRHKWRDVLEYDPYYNPNLGIADEEFALAQPPRLMHPWDRYKYYPNPVDSESTR